MISNKTTLRNQKLANVSKYIFLGLLAYMPFHVFLANWIGTELNLLEYTKAAKEPIMLIGFLSILYAERKSLVKTYAKDRWLYAAIIAYSSVVVLSAAIFNNNHFAESIGIAYDLRLVIFFIYGILIASRFKNQIRKQAIKIVLISGVLVAIIGVFQVLLLPNNTLSYLGYNKSTGSQQVFYIHDDTQTTERAFSTIKDPNALGAYLGVILILLITFLATKKNKPKIFDYVCAITVLVCLFLTYSRSAWIGLAAGLAFLALFLFINNQSAQKFVRKNIKSIMVLVISLTVLLTGFLMLQPNIYRDVILHNRFNNKVDSNTKRLDQYSEALSVIKNNPVFGMGVGAAGPVSFKNLPNRPIVSENYYFQILEEYGLLGFVFFAYIIIYIFAKLYKSAKNYNTYSLAILTSLVVVLVANLFNHTWTIESVAYVWWGLAGLFLYNSKNFKPEQRGE